MMPNQFIFRNDPKYISALGRTIQNFSRVVPGGLLVFFPSYPVMKKCQDEWQAMGIWSNIVEQKVIDSCCNYLELVLIF